MAEFDKNGQIIRKFIPAAGPDGVAAVWQDGVWTAAVLSRNGSVLALVDELGDVRGRYVYGPYGDLLSSTGEFSNQPRRFAGALWVEEVGLYYLRARWYDPEVGQFTTRDPEWKLEIDPYGYASQRPLRLVDPGGMSSNASEAAGLGYGQVVNQVKGKVLGPWGPLADLGGAIWGYTGDKRKNFSVGFSKIWSVTMLDKSKAGRSIKDAVENYVNLGKDKRPGKRETLEEGIKRLRDPCDRWDDNLLDDGSWDSGGTADF